MMGDRYTGIREGDGWRLISLDDQIKCIEREIALRRRVYPRRVAEGRMKLDEAEREVSAMRAVLMTLEGRK